MMSRVCRGGAIVITGAAFLLGACLLGACQSGTQSGGAARDARRTPPAKPELESARVETPFETRWKAMSRDERVAWMKKNYVKRECRVPMRDGVYLFANVYTPRGASASKTYPILLRRTPYSCAPYGDDKFSDNPGPAGTHYLESGYIFVNSDVRGRNMSEGLFEDMRPHDEGKGPVARAPAPGTPGAPGASSDQGFAVRTVSINGALPPPTRVDESSDTWDTVEWLVQNLPGNNGRVGMWGISYPGFYCSAGMIDAHPALVAVSPQAPIGDWYFDDFFHHGAFFLPHNFNFFSGFGKARPLLTPGGGNPADRLEHGTPDGYQFFLDLGPLTNVNDKYYKHTIPFWDEICDRPNYDEFWQSHNILPRLRNISPNVMVVGGWFDAEDLYGAINTYQSANALNRQAGPGLTRDPGAAPDAVNTTFVIGPWFHGGWHRSEGDFLGNVSFDCETSLFYQDLIEFPFFEHTLKGKSGSAAPKLPEAYVFETGANHWRKFDVWPPMGMESRTLWFGANGALSFERAEGSAADAAFDEYTTDPAKPAPYIEETAIGMTRQYMTDDQRFAARRPDVLSYQTDVLTEDLTIAGPMLADLWASIALANGVSGGADSDFIVKLIDVFPKDTKDNSHTRVGVRMGNYHMLVRSETFRGRFRNSYERPEPFAQNETTRVGVPLQDVLHTFEKGHRIMIQVQSAWFPLIDRNPQKWVDNIFKAKAEDFTKATQRIHRSGDTWSGVKVSVLSKAALDAAACPEAEAYELRPKAEAAKPAE